MLDRHRDYDSLIFKQIDQVLININSIHRELTSAERNSLTEIIDLISEGNSEESTNYQKNNISGDEKKSSDLKIYPKLEYLIRELINKEEQGQEFYSFILILSALDDTDTVFDNISNDDAIKKIISAHRSEGTIKDAFKSGNSAKLLNSENLVDTAFQYWLMIRSKKLSEFMMEESKLRFFRIKIELRFLAAYISQLNFSKEDNLEISQILKLIGGSGVLIDFGDQSEKIQGTISNQYAIQKLFEGIKKKPFFIKEESKYSKGKRLIKPWNIDKNLDDEEDFWFQNDNENGNKWITDVDGMNLKQHQYTDPDGSEIFRDSGTPVSLPIINLRLLRRVQMASKRWVIC